MKAQMVKNAVIVPDGSKGGFVLKRLAGLARGAEGRGRRRQYVTFMRGLLDITDNLVQRRDRASGARPRARRRRPVPRRGRRQGDGHVLRHRERGQRGVRLLARATRSRRGGSPGLRPQGAGDHGARRVGVGEAPLPRARHRRDDRAVHGGRHRRHVGRRLRQRHAAVAAASSSSRRSTTGTCSSIPTPTRRVASPSASGCSIPPGSSWNDYDRSLLSAGGDVFDRRAKCVTSSPQVRAALGIADDAPEEMTADRADPGASCRRPVDLLWNGGIGTYVKASTESNADVGDRANDPVRVNGERAARAGRRRGRQPRVHAARADRVRARPAGASTPTSSTTRPASTRPTTRSTSRSCSGSRSSAASSRWRSATSCCRSVRDDVVRPRAVRQLPAGADPVAGDGASALSASRATRT